MLRPRFSYLAVSWSTKRGGGLFRMGEDGETAPVQVGARALDLLSALVARHGELVTKQEIMNAVVAVLDR